MDPSMIECIWVHVHYYWSKAGLNRPLRSILLKRNVECFRDGLRVAVKIIKNLQRYREAAMSEVEVLEQMNKLDSSSK